MLYFGNSTSDGELSCAEANDARLTEAPPAEHRYKVK